MSASAWARAWVDYTAGGMKARLVTLAIVAAFGVRGTAQRPAGTAPITYADAKPILEQLQARLPVELASHTPADLEARWPGWVARRNAAIRARLEQGDED